MRVKAIFVGADGTIAGEYEFNVARPPREGADSGDLAQGAKEAFDKFALKHGGFRLVGSVAPANNDVSVKFVKVAD